MIQPHRIADILIPINVFPHPLGRLLDIATGDGALLSALLEAIPNVTHCTAIDIDEQSLRESREQFRHHPRAKDIEVRCASALSLPFEDNSFDTITMFHAFHHFADPRLALREAKRVLRLRGYLIAGDMICNNLSIPERNARDLHHLKSAIDRLHGITHRDTYRSCELAAFFAELELDDPSLTINPYPVEQGEAAIQRGKFIIDYVETVAEHCEYQPLLRSATAIVERIERHGFQRAPLLIMRGRRT